MWIRLCLVDDTDMLIEEYIAALLYSVLLCSQWFHYQLDIGLMDQQGIINTINGHFKFQHHCTIKCNNLELCYLN